MKSETCGVRETPHSSQQNLESAAATGKSQLPDSKRRAMPSVGGVCATNADPPLISHKQMERCQAARRSCDSVQLRKARWPSFIGKLASRFRASALAISLFAITPSGLAQRSHPKIGPEGSEADVWVKRGARIELVSPELLDALPAVIRTWEICGLGRLTITSGHEVFAKRLQQFTYHIWRDETGFLALDFRMRGFTREEGKCVEVTLPPLLPTPQTGRFDVVIHWEQFGTAWFHLHLELERGDRSRLVRAKA